MCVGKCVRECEYTCVFVCVLAMCVFVALFLPGIFSAASAMINCLCRSLRLCHDSRCEFHDKTNVPQAEPSNASDSHTPAEQISAQPSPGNCT